MSLNPSIRKVVPMSPPTASANYDYFDIAEGSGVKNFYACTAIASGAQVASSAIVHYLTTDATDYSAHIADKVKPATGGALSIRRDRDFDLIFNLPKLIYGKARCSLSQGVDSGSGTTGVFCKIFLYHVREGTETLMSSAVTEQTSKGGVGQTSTTKNVGLDLTSHRWHFKKGDILRLNVQIWGYGNPATPDTIGIGIDPKDRDDVADYENKVISDVHTTQLKLSVPFIIDI